MTQDGWSRGEPCPKCPSSDAFKRHTDGHAHCFSCDHHEGEGGATSVRAKKREGSFEPLTGEYIALTKRNISEDTCRKWGYSTGTFAGKAVQIANYVVDGAIVAQKVRFPNKEFTFLGEPKRAGLYGMHLWRDGGRMVVITEGEIDALSVSQLQGNKWPVVSVPNGAKGAKRDLEKNLEWLERFEKVVLMFDNDEPGNEAALECAPLFSPGKCCIARLDLKDANDMLKAGRGTEVIDALWGAKVYRPDGIIAGADITVEMLTEAPVKGYTTGYPGLDEKLRGLRKAELTLFTAGTGIGKSTIVREIGKHLCCEENLVVSNVFLEESFKKTAQAYVAIDRDIPLGNLRSNPAIITPAQYVESMARTVHRMHFYNHFGSLESANLLAKLRYMAVSLKTDFILLDHISIVVSGQESSREGERKDIDRLMTHLRSLIEETGVGVVAIAHLAKAEGRTHEEGGRVAMNDLRGSGTLKQIPDNIVALERDQQSEDTPNEADVRLLKNREYGELGIACRVSYDSTTGRLREIGAFDNDEPEGSF